MLSQAGTFRVKWAEVSGFDWRQVDKQAKRIAKLSAMLKRAGFALAGTDDNGFVIYVQSAKPTPRRGSTC